MKPRTTTLAGLLALTLALPASAQAPAEAKLSIGDAAPPLELGQWVKGEAVTRLGGGRITVVDFWATWCGPCIAAIPHMSELQAKYADKDVDLIGVSIWEHSPSRVAPFVTQRDENDVEGDEMAYRVAMDKVPPLPEGVEEGSREARANASQGAMARTWMQAAGRNGIPSVFIVDREGKIAWIGHPFDGMDEALAAIVAGEYDLEAAAEAMARKAAEKQALNQVMGRVTEAAQAGDLEQLQQVAREHLERELWNNAGALNAVAWTIVDPAQEWKAERDLDLALKAAERANELSDQKNGAILDTLARVHFRRGDIQGAIEAQRSAVEHAEGPMKEELEKVLREYEAARQGS